MTPITASAPASMPIVPPPASRWASRHAKYSPSSPPTRAVITHRVGAAPPNSPHTLVNRNGSGFQDGPPLIRKLRCGSVSSRPHTIHENGS